MKKYHIELTVAEREMLIEKISQGKYKNTRLRRAHVLLGGDESAGGKNMNDEQIHLAYGISIRSVERTRRRFVEQGFDMALNGKERPVNRKIMIDGRAESHLIALRCSDPPSGSGEWTLRLLANKMVELGYIPSISHQSVKNVLKKHQLKPGE